MPHHGMVQSSDWMDHNRAWAPTLPRSPTTAELTQTIGPRLGTAGMSSRLCHSQRKITSKVCYFS